MFGFDSFLSYSGYGYLDTWHGAETLVLLPCFLVGLLLTRRHVTQPLFGPESPALWVDVRRRFVGMLLDKASAILRYDDPIRISQGDVRRPRNHAEQTESPHLIALPRAPKS